MDATLSWGVLFQRLWRLLKLRFAKQRMCGECGDALIRRGRPDVYWDTHPRWACEACEEWRATQERNKPKPTAEELEAQRRFAELLRGQVGAPIRYPHPLGGLLVARSLDDAQQHRVRQQGLIGGVMGGIGNPLGNLFGRLQ